jgi:hypothetical protein
VLLLPQSSYSDYVFGYSDNAAAGGSSWGMSSALFGVPAMEAVDINGVYYQYTAVKDREDAYTVSIQNKDADLGGYIFRETDDWSGRSGGTIQKFVPVPYSPVGRWDTGNIEEVGIGSVQDPVVLYSYRFDPDRVQQQAIPELPTYDVYDALSDRYVNAALEPTDLSLIEGDEDAEKDKDEEIDEDRLETALAASENALTIGMGMSQSAMIKAMNSSTSMQGYYDRQIAGGVYKETIVLQDKNIPDNRRALRQMSQQKLHKQMVDQQYGR